MKDSNSNARTDRPITHFYSAAKETCRQDLKHSFSRAEGRESWSSAELKWKLVGRGFFSAAKLGARERDEET